MRINKDWLLIIGVVVIGMVAGLIYNVKQVNAEPQYREMRCEQTKVWNLKISVLDDYESDMIDLYRENELLKQEIKKLKSDILILEFEIELRERGALPLPPPEMFGEERYSDLRRTTEDDVKN